MWILFGEFYHHQENGILLLLPKIIAMNTKDPVSKIMTKKVIVATVKNRFSQVRDLFTKYNIHHLPVTENDTVIGIISTHDVIAAYEKLSKKIRLIDDKVLDVEVPIESLMTKKPDTVSSDTPIKKVVELFNKKGYHALPIVDDGKIRGIVTTNDLTKLFKD